MTFLKRYQKGSVAQTLGNDGGGTIYPNTQDELYNTFSPCNTILSNNAINKTQKFMDHKYNSYQTFTCFDPLGSLQGYNCNT